MSRLPHERDLSMRGRAHECFRMTGGFAILGRLTLLANTKAHVSSPPSDREPCATQRVAAHRCDQRERDERQATRPRSTGEHRAALYANGPDCCKNLAGSYGCPAQRTSPRGVTCPGAGRRQQPEARRPGVTRHIHDKHPSSGRAQSSCYPALKCACTRAALSSVLYSAMSSITPMNFTPPVHATPSQ